MMKPVGNAGVSMHSLAALCASSPPSPSLRFICNSSLVFLLSPPYLLIAGSLSVEQLKGYTQTLSMHCITCGVARISVALLLKYIFLFLFCF
jgi:hypothetical protein